MYVIVHPKFCRARLVPYALQEAVEAAYNCQETEGIAEKVQFSEWPQSRWYHVLNCGDYNVDIYPGRSIQPKVVFRKVMHWIKLEFRDVGF